MSSEAGVQPRTLGEFFDLQRGTTYRSALLGEPGPVLLGLASIQRNGGFRDGNLKTYGGDSPEKLLLSPGDMYVSLKDVTQSGDLLGAVARVPTHVEYGRITQDTVKLIPRPGAEPLLSYVFWLLRTPQYRAYCRQHAMGTTNLSMSRDAFLAYDVPSFTTARKNVLRVLEALHDKIQNNERRCTLHAEMIDALFSHHVLARDEPDDAESYLTSIARFVNGGAFTKGATGTGRPVLRIKELNSGISQTTVFNDLDVRDENIARHHDLLFSWSGSLDAYRWHGPDALINQHIFKVIPVDGFPVWFVEGWIRHHLPVFKGIAQDKATTMGHIKREHLTQAKVRSPPGEVIAGLNDVLAPLDEQMAVVAREATTLRALRDELLPKLVSGEIRVAPDADDGDEPTELAA